jgi:hypothetical protein
VKIAALSSFTRDAIARTHGPVDDRDERQPTWNGRMLFIARLTEEAHVLHEVAHWIVAEKKERLAANYGLGTDPDGGPITGPWGPFTYTEHKEVEATLVTQHLLRLAGLPYGYGADTRVLPWFEGSDIDRAWLIVSDLLERGIAAADPLRGLSKKGFRGHLRQLDLPRARP